MHAHRRALEDAGARAEPRSLAEIFPQQGNAALIAVPNTGVKVSGLIIDAGPVNSPVLLSVGIPGPGNASDPDLIQDIFFRVGGAETPFRQGEPVQAHARCGEGVVHSPRPDAGSSATSPGLPGGEGMKASATPT